MYLVTHRRESRTLTALIWRHATPLVLTAMLGALSCTPAPAPAPPAPAPVGDMDLNAAAKQVATDLSQQITAGPGRPVVIDPILDRSSGQQTGVSVRVEAALAPALTSAGTAKGLSILPFTGEGAASARFVMAGTVSLVTAPDHYALSVSLTDKETGLVVAQSAARFVEAGLDQSPTKFYNDSPSLTRDRSVDGYVRTSETHAGSPADALYVSQLSTSALLAEALDAYNAERWEQSLSRYTAASQRPDGAQLRTFNGIYLTNVRLGRLPAAEAAFGRIAQLGLATNNLAVKLLFKPGSSTEFWPGAQLAGVYPMWVRQIARAAQSTRVCLKIVGHTSRSGSEAVNDPLSLSRAETVKKMMEAEVRGLSAQLSATGVGFRENIVGTGKDDASDAIDRRVEFKVIECVR